jgi:hypothetical protein
MFTLPSSGANIIKFFFFFTQEKADRQKLKFFKIFFVTFKKKEKQQVNGLSFYINCLTCFMYLKL